MASRSYRAVVIAATCVSLQLTACRAGFNATVDEREAAAASDDELPASGGNTSGAGMSDGPSVDDPSSGSPGPTVGLPSAFTIEGISGGADVEPDAWFRDTTVPLLSWSARKATERYVISVVTEDETPVCTITENSGTKLSTSLDSCVLALGEHYRVTVTADDADGTETVADNAPYWFRFVGPSGVASIIENYAEGAHTQGGWRTYRSSFGFGHAEGFVLESVAMADTYLRRLNIQGDVNDGMTAMLDDSVYLERYGAIPVDGAGDPVGQWPWSAELLTAPECQNDVELTFGIRDVYSLTMASALINYTIRGSGADRQIFGYQLLVNQGGNTVTVSRFVDGDDHVFAFMDLWPGRRDAPNPAEHGPYKGWDWTVGRWPAGGTPNGPERTVAVRYQWDEVNREVTLSYELRPMSGEDATPGVWDAQRVFKGVDALPPGGDYGIWAGNYRRWMDPGEGVEGDVKFANFELTCR